MSSYSKFQLLLSSERFQFWSIFLLALVVRAIAAHEPYLFPWDERFHALAARNMLDFPFEPHLLPYPDLNYDWHEWRWNYIWLHKPPLTLWLIALSLKLCGICEFAVRIPSVILGSFGASATFLIARRLYSPAVAVTAGVIHALDNLTIQLSAGRHRTDHPDAQFLVWCELTILALLLFRDSSKLRWILAASLALCAALLTKWLFALFVLPVGGLLLWESLKFQIAVKSIFAVALVSLALALPWTIYTNIYYPELARWEAQFNIRHIFEPLDGHIGQWSYHLMNLWKYHGRLIYIPIILGLVTIFRNRRLSDAALFVWIFIPYFFFSAIATKMPGYVTPAYPALFILVALGFFSLCAHKGVIQSIAAQGVAVLTAVLMLRETTSLYSEAPKDLPARIESADLYRRVGSQLGDEDRRNTIYIGVRNPIEAMFYLGSLATTKEDSDPEIQALRARGFKIVDLKELGSLKSPEHL